MYKRQAPTKLALSLPFFLSCWRRTRLSQRAWVLIMGCIPALRASADCGRAARRPSNPRRRCFTSGAHTSFQAKIFGFGNQSLARRRVRCDGAPQLPLGFAPPREPLPGRRKQTLCGPGRKSQACMLRTPGAYMKGCSVVPNARSGQAHMPSSTDRRLLRCLLDEWRRDQA